MAPSREIEKLQRRWQENPLGLTFAPLAEAYRKEGLYADALELLEIGLTQHPNYVPAHIVRGRCHLDTRSDAQAESAFRRVLDLDPENVIALKGLAEIAERSARFDEAAGHLERLLAFDRNNDEARAQLDRIRSMLATPSPGTIEPQALDGGRGVPPPGPEKAEAEVETEPVVEETTEPEAALEPFVVSLDEVETTVTEGPLEAETAEADEAKDEELITDLEPEVPGLDLAAAFASDESDTGLEEVAEAPEEEPVPAEVVDADAQDLEVVLFQPVDLTAGAPNEYQVPSDADDLHPRAEAERGPGDDDVGEPSLIRIDEDETVIGLPALETEGPEPIEPELEPVTAEADAIAEVESALEEAEGADEFPGATEPMEAWVPNAEAEPLPEPEPVGAVAESEEPVQAPAELEGDLGLEALGVEEEAPEPEQLLTSDGKDTPADEPELVVTETMAEIFLRQGHRELALAVYSQLAQREPANERIREARRALEAELRPAETGSTLPVYAAALTGGQSVRSFFEQLLGAPRPGEGPSLGAVFGESSSSEDDAEPMAEPGPSYDEFFHDAGGTAEIPPARTLPPRQPRATPSPEPAGPSPEAQDIEEFNTWLRGLKR